MSARLLRRHRHAIMVPLYYAVSFVLVGFHSVLGDIFMDPTSAV